MNGYVDKIKSRTKLGVFRTGFLHDFALQFRDRAHTAFTTLQGNYLIKI